MRVDMSSKVEELKLYAEANYDAGMDVFVECYSDSEWGELLGKNNNSLCKTKEAMRALASVYSERQQHAVNSGF